jgi:pimeloyl-ACP methyl ester carboxylesterase
MADREYPATSETVLIPPHGLDGVLDVPPQAAKGVVLFAHGSGSSRLSPRNRAVAAALQARRLATLLYDLLTRVEAEDRRCVFDIELLASRLEHALDWAVDHPRLAPLPTGLFGASTGAAAALVAAALHPLRVAAVVSRGGRPDLAAERLPQVRAPTLLIVGGADEEVLQLNRMALERLGCEKRLEIVPGASHLFPEPGGLERVSTLAGDWFVTHLGAAARAVPR